MQFKSLQTVFFVAFSIIFQINLIGNTSIFCHTFDSEGPCDEIYFPGQIGSDHTVCLQDNMPTSILSLADANNGNGEYEYMWIKTTVDPTNPSVVWLSIPGATSASYNAPALLQTTWFRRCSRPAGCLAYNGESNEVKITVESCIDPCEEFKINVFNKVTPTCHDAADGNIQLAIEGGEAPFSINWNGNDANGLMAENLAGGTFSVEITDANGCYASEIIQLTAPEALKVNSYKNDVTCFAANDGWITLSVDGGTAPYTYEYNGVVTTENELRDLAGGVYEILVTDQKGCQNTTAIQIFEPAKIELTAISTPESCLQNDASVQVAMEGGLAPFNFTWDNEETTQNLNNLTTGDYFLIVQDRNDCTAHLEVTVDNNCAPVTIDFEEVMLNKMGENSIKIDWMAYNETPDGVFLVERSVDGVNFEIIGEPVSGNEFSTNGNGYYLMDDAPKNGLNYYQIRHYDNEGNVCVSAINSLFFETENTPEMSIYPNPVANEVHFDFLQPTENQITIQLTNALGNTLITKVVEKGFRFSAIDLSELPAGTYFTQISNKNTHFTKTIIKE